MRRSIYLASLSILSLAMTATGDEPVSLRYRFAPGQVVRYASSLEDNYDITVGSANDKPYSRQKSVKSYRVVAVTPEGDAELELMFESVVMTIHQNGQTFEYDSQKKSDDMELIFAAMNAMVGKPHLRLTVDPRGGVSRIQNLLDPEAKADEASLAALDAFVRLPDEAVAPGAVWKEEHETAISFPDSRLQKPVKLQRRYTLRSVENGVALIDFDTKILSLIRDPQEEVQLIRRTPRGIIALDLKQGVLQRREFSQNNEVTGFDKGQTVMRFQQRLEDRLLTVQTAAK